MSDPRLGYELFASTGAWEKESLEFLHVPMRQVWVLSSIHPGGLSNTVGMRFQASRRQISFCRNDESALIQ
jgi:hypothetical protein